jgi:hypothetical protein
MPWLVKLLDKKSNSFQRAQAPERALSPMVGCKSACAACISERLLYSKLTAGDHSVCRLPASAEMVADGRNVYFKDKPHFALGLR